MSINSYQNVDRAQLAEDLDEIHNDVITRIDIQDFHHLKKLELWGKVCSILGYGSAWIVPNPISALLISQGSFSRWTLLTHPVVHKGYDKIKDIPARYTSKQFARGWRRFIDWPDWITPAGWHQEHDVLHHYNLGESEDPDCIQQNMTWLRQSKMPMWLRFLLVGMTATTWKLFYYVPKTQKELQLSRVRKNRQAIPEMPFKNTWSFFSPEGKALWVECVLPYACFRFILFPLIFLPFGLVAAINVLLNSILAEALTNLHSFLVIFPNHAGDDVMMFEEKCKGGRGEFYLRQILGSVNYRTGSDLNDFFHGWLNYQIEHHLWPDIPLSQYQYVQPKVVAVCKKHGIPYRQQSVFKRFAKAVDIMVGRTTMLKPLSAR